jgi:hypothetical protein
MQAGPSHVLTVYTLGGRRQFVADQARQWLVLRDLSGQLHAFHQDRDVFVISIGEIARVDDGWSCRLAT